VTLRLKPLQVGSPFLRLLQIRRNFNCFQSYEAMLRIVFKHGMIIYVHVDPAEEVPPTLYDNEIATKAGEIRDALATAACYHRIKRGKMLGIRCRLWNHGKTVAVPDVPSLPAGDVSYLAWELVQEHQDATTKQLLDTVTQLQAQKSSLLPPFNGILSELVVKLKFHLVWATNAVEGSSYTLNDTALAIIHGIAAAGKSAEELCNAIDGGHAVDYLRQLIDAPGEAIVTETGLKHLHKLLWAHSFKPIVQVGEFRRREIAVHGSSFVFPLPDDVPALMAAFMQWLNSPDRNVEHPVAFAAEAHLRFATILPFEDGNGRVARLLMNLVLLKRGYPPVSIAPTCRSEYFAALRHYHYHTVTTESTRFLEIVVNEAMAALEAVLQEARAAPMG
jgi:Fic family protein